MIKINHEYIISRGYKSYSPTHFHNEYIIQCFQKCFDDDIGKKYFIDINQYEPVGENLEKYNFEYSVQLYDKDTHNPIDMLFHCGWDLERVEEFIENLFQSESLDYYEKWDE